MPPRSFARYLEPHAARSGLLGALTWSYLGYAYALDGQGRYAPALFALLRCPFLLLTGIPCPLCGTTRAWHAALHGHWSAAFAFHPVAPLLLVLAVPFALLCTYRFAAGRDL